MLEGFLFGFGFWGSLIAISAAIAIIFLVIMFLSYIINNGKTEDKNDNKPSNVISSDDLWGK